MGVAGAVLLATSPVFLYQIVQPMSDVPVTAWWALTLAPRADKNFRAPALFAVGALPGCLAVAALNRYWYGSPFKSGYGSFDYLYQMANVSSNVVTYPVWLLESQTPMVLLAVAARFCFREPLERRSSTRIDKRQSSHEPPRCCGWYSSSRFSDAMCLRSLTGR